MAVDTEARFHGRVGPGERPSQSDPCTSEPQPWIPGLVRRAEFRSPPALSASDERLVALTSLGHEDAFEAIVERYRPLLLGHCRGIVGDAGAQDAVQQAFLSAWSELRRGCEVRVLRPWLFMIAHRAALQALREQRARCDQLPESLTNGRSPADDAEQSSCTRDALTAIAELPETERQALMWTAVHGRSGRDTAHALGVSENTVRQLVYRARTKVKAATAHIFIPPVFVYRLLAHRWVRPLIPSADGSPGSPVGGTLAKIVAVAAAGALIAAPVAILHAARQAGHGARTSTAITSRGTPPSLTSTARAISPSAHIQVRGHTGALRQARPTVSIPRRAHPTTSAAVAQAPGAYPARSTSTTVAYENPSRNPPAAVHRNGNSSGGSGQVADQAADLASQSVKQVTAAAGRALSSVTRQQALPAVTQPVLPGVTEPVLPAVTQPVLPAVAQPGVPTVTQLPVADGVTHW